MKVCAHMNLGPHVNVYLDAPSISYAVREFRHRLERHYGVVDGSILERTGLDYAPCLDVYSPCPAATLGLHCSDTENFHDYPMLRYRLGPRGGIVRVPT
jgi:hypothetical protein